MKTFGDLNIGDKAYIASQYLNKVSTVQVCHIVRWETTKLLRLRFFEDQMQLVIEADRTSYMADGWNLFADYNYAHLTQAMLIYKDNFFLRKQIRKSKHFKRLINNLKNTISSIIHVRGKNI